MIQLPAIGPTELALLGSIVIIPVALSLISKVRAAINKNPYKAAVLEAHARALLSKANWVVAMYVALGVLLGVIGATVVGACAASLQALSINVPLGYMVGASFLLPLLVCIARGQNLASVLRFQAHSLLCQWQIEQNTRRAADAVQRMANRATVAVHAPPEAVPSRTGSFD